MSSAADSKKAILLVCLGNICRSPLAEAVMAQVLREAGIDKEWLVDSCGTSNWHVGESPDSRAIACLKRHGLSTDHQGRQLCKEDFHRFDYIFGMDNNNIREIKRVAPPHSKAQIDLLRRFDPQGGDVIEDPYYGSMDDFELVYQQSRRSCEQFVKHIAS